MNHFEFNVYMNDIVKFYGKFAYVSCSKEQETSNSTNMYRENLVTLEMNYGA